MNQISNKKSHGVVNLDNNYLRLDQIHY